MCFILPVVRTWINLHHAYVVYALFFTRNGITINILFLYWAFSHYCNVIIYYQNFQCQQTQTPPLFPTYAIGHTGPSAVDPFAPHAIGSNDVVD